MPVPYLIAQGDQPQHRWRREVPVDRKVILGREHGPWSAWWDEQISRRHVEMHWHRGRLEVVRLPQSRNPVFFRGRKVQQCLLKPGEHFVVGKTVFTLSDEPITLTQDKPSPLTEERYSSRYLRQLRFRDAERRIDVLSRLPELILGAANDAELLRRVVNVVLSEIAPATAVAVVSVEIASADPGALEVLYWDQRPETEAGFRPSERLIREAIDRGESILHVWGETAGRPTEFTHREDVDWACCTPLPGSACGGWAIYVEGRMACEATGTPHTPPSIDLRDDLKFAELVAAALANHREVQVLQRRHASLSPFFSPLVLEALSEEDPDLVLAPREATVTVLFCDLRGFSRRSEQWADDLIGLLRRVSGALGVMTKHILNRGGVVGDFHGDSAMGFWGWPLAQPDTAEQACQAALDIRAEFEVAARRSDDPLRGFRIGVGIATGTAVAGKIGTSDLVKITAFGPVVNLASRLEGMTKAIRAPILLDETTAGVIRRQVSPEWARVRRLAVVKPHGMDSSIEVSELLPPESEYPVLSHAHLETFEAAVDALGRREWERAFELLHEIPAEDRVKDFLTVFIAQHDRSAPLGWDGVVPIPAP